MERYKFYKTKHFFSASLLSLIRSYNNLLKGENYDKR